MTAHPTAEWLARQLTEACGWDPAPRYSIRDRAGAYGLEKIVIDGGTCRGRTYRVEDLTARWLTAKGIVEFYDADRCLMASVNLFEELAPQQMAA